MMHTSECIHHTNTRTHEDTLHILHNIYSTYTSWRMCHAHVTHTLYILHRAYVAYTHWCIHHTEITVYVDTLYIHYGVYTAYAPWRTCHAYVELHMQSNIAILAVYRMNYVACNALDHDCSESLQITCAIWPSEVSSAINQIPSVLNHCKYSLHLLQHLLWKAWALC